MACDLGYSERDISTVVLDLGQIAFQGSLVLTNPAYYAELQKYEQGKICLQFFICCANIVAIL